MTATVDRTLPFHIAVDRVQQALIVAIKPRSKGRATPALSGDVLRVALFMLRYVNRAIFEKTGNLVCWVSPETIAVATGLAADGAVRRARRCLCRLGIVSREGEGRDRKYFFEIEWAEATLAELAQRMAGAKARNTCHRRRDAQRVETVTERDGTDPETGALASSKTGALAPPDSSEDHSFEFSPRLRSGPCARRTGTRADFDDAKDRVEALIEHIANPPPPEKLVAFIGHLRVEYGAEALDAALDCALDEPYRPRTWKTAKSKITGILASQGYPRHSAPGGRPGGRWWGRRLGENWSPTAEQIDYATQQGFSLIDIERMADKFRNHFSGMASSNPNSIRADWSGAWKSWVIRERRPRRSAGGAPGYTAEPYGDLPSGIPEPIRPKSSPPPSSLARASRVPEPEFPPMPPRGQRDIGDEARWMIGHAKGPGTPEWATWALCWGGEHAARNELAKRWGGEAEVRRGLAA